MPDTTLTTADPKRRFLCRHVHAKGNRCGSPSLRGRHFCYYHDRTRRDVPSSRIGTFEMPRVDDRAAIQIALFEVLARLASGDIDYKRGTSILYGLQIASSNLRHDHLADQPAADQPAVVEDIVLDPYHGDLAPIAELPTPEPTAPTSTPDITLEDAVIPEQASKLKEAVILERSSRTSVFPPATNPSAAVPPTPLPSLAAAATQLAPRAPYRSAPLACSANFVPASYGLCTQPSV